MSKARLALALLLLSACATACRPQIGDDCASSVDCSAQGDRLCDTSQPDGYCTIFSCEPDNCPNDDSVCVGFGLELAASCDAPNAADPRWPRFERTFCMAPCEVDDDCREGYQCLAPSARGAISIDIESDIRDSKVCFASSGTPTTATTAACAP